MLVTYASLNIVLNTFRPLVEEVSNSRSAPEIMRAFPESESVDLYDDLISDLVCYLKRCMQPPYHL